MDQRGARAVHWRGGFVHSYGGCGVSEYRIETLNDLLKVPSDKLDECLRGIQYAIELHHLAFGVDGAGTPINSITWKDDGDMSVRVSDMDGNPVLALEVTEAEQE
jgi:hypothetical protein